MATVPHASAVEDDDDCPELIDAKVPVVILTGFLGSGKTTLLQYILTQPHQLKIAVIVNEFEFGRSIEKGLTMKSSEKEDDEWLELNNGCLCCTAKTQTVLALENLIAKKGSLDLILIETSGLADPAPVAAMFWQDDALQSALYLAGIITLVDCKNIVSYLGTDQYKEASQQLLVADRIVFNKLDLLGASASDEAAVEAAREVEKAKVVETVQRINPVAEYLFTSFSRIDDLRAILSLNTTNEDVVDYVNRKKDAVAAAEATHGHTSGITTLCVEIAPGEDGAMVLPSKLAADALYAKLLYHGGEEAFTLVRSKAAVWIGESAADARPWQIQSIGDLFDVVPMASASGLPHLTSRFLILGRGVTDGGRVEQLVRDAFLAGTKRARSE